MINEKALREYLFNEFRGVRHVDITKLGSGVQGAGFLVSVVTEEGERSYVVKALIPEGLGHDYPSDRAAVFLLDLDEYKNLPRHVRAVDVLAEWGDGTLHSIGGGIEYYLLMERAEGTDYFKDLSGFAAKERLDPLDRGKIRAMAAYLAGIHAVKKDSRALYWRKIRDTVGHGECLMGVFDTYPDGTLSYQEMAEIEKGCVNWRARLKPKCHRLSMIHGDFHPGNIWFTSGGELSAPGQGTGSATDFVLLDRSRGPWGDPADDITALAINYIFFSIIRHGHITGPYYEGLALFFEEYGTLSGDEELYEVLAPFFAFRGVVVANPVFYPDISEETRAKLFSFVRNVLAADRFEVEKVNAYIGVAR
ncbi:MAG: aminoglycoside phosphotransferase family protein [Alphaproteobacteria bacterium]|uniref:Aminoglycoside phosphotransferase family protein n=1 Tax=Candidatus Nitrobium versatile TaxID=2884831 RepID=A0A953JD18_9BACT|nr:aminoglycoside phosphotransferase family protein [Candidatus Nitrobium versatile]